MRPHGIEGHAQGRQVMQQSRDAGRQDHEQAPGQEHAVEQHGGRKVDVDAPQGGPAQQPGRDEPAEVRPGEQHIGHFAGQVGAVAHGHAHMGGGQGRRVVDAVAHHEDLAALGGEVGDDVGLVGGQDLRTVFLEAQLAGHGTGGTLVVAGEHEDTAEAQLFELFEDLRAFGTQGVLDGQEPGQLAVDGQIEQRASHPGLGVDLRLQGRKVDAFVAFDVVAQWVRPIKIEDLLGRSEIHINMEEVMTEFCGKVVLVTGAAGSIGSELCRQLAQMNIKKLIMFDSAESPLHNVRLEFEKNYPDLDFVPVIGDVRVKERLRMVFETYQPQIIFHAAAYKHVPLMEENPCEAVLVNVVGSRQVADMAVEYGAEKMIMVSTDKAVNPTNVMGCSKRLAEIYVQSLGCAIREGKVKGHTKFITTRFGNVLGSNGSVIPRFKEQIENGGPVTVTHPDIIRFFMTIPEACRLVMEAATMGEGNEIFVFEMGKAVKIVDLATRMIELAGYRPGEDIEIEFTGLRPGEKLYEEVLSDKENTIPTENKKIMIAKVRHYEYTDILDTYTEFEKLSRSVQIMDTVKLMKRVVPEFKSKNSPRFEVLDR